MLGECRRISLLASYRTRGRPGLADGKSELKRIAFNRTHATRFRSLLLCMSLSQNRRTLLGDTHYSAARPIGRAKIAVAL
ncbi:hypothetical protein GGE07_003787 [Sinorhizobium terangae]|nr:hypothetical protein [Sinorhizobium terangae]